MDNPKLSEKPLDKKALDFDYDKHMRYELDDLYYDQPVFKVKPVQFDESPCSFSVFPDAILSPFPGALNKLVGTVNLAMEMHNEKDLPVCDTRQGPVDQYMRKTRNARFPFYWTRLAETVQKKSSMRNVNIKTKALSPNFMTLEHCKDVDAETSEPSVSAESDDSSSSLSGNRTESEFSKEVTSKVSHGNNTLKNLMSLSPCPTRFNRKITGNI